MARKTKIAKEDLEEKKLKFQNIAGNIEVISTEKFLKDNFLPYAWSFNLDRALVDVTGLKPVQRRILYTMFKEGLNPNANRSKVATLAGRVLTYHPHGNMSVSEALKNLARDHIFRVPLIDGKGDFGVPGTPGAADRYIDAKLNAAAWINVKEINDHAVSMVPNYDGTHEEPLKLPVRWPIAIINGGSGIATAYSASIPSHNPTEIMKACKALLKNPEMTHKALQKIVLGPDFNMGGVITSNDGIKQYMETGNGTFKIRGKYEVRTVARGASRIEFYEIPFGTNPEKIIQEIQNAMDKKEIFKDLSNFKDLSDLRHPIRIVVETKPGVNHRKVVQDLFKHTSLESNFSANLTTVVDNRPLRTSVRDLLLNFIEFRKACVANKSKHSLEKSGKRLHLIDGLLKTLIDVDKAIKIIRASENSEEAKEKLEKAFKIDDAQSDYVLALQLRRLTKMDKHELEDEKKQLEEEVNYLESLLSEYDVLVEHLQKEFDETIKVIGDERKTEINSLSQEEFLTQEKDLAKNLKNSEKSLPCYVTRFENGKLIKTMEPFEFSSRMKKFPNGGIVEQVKMKTQDELVVVGTDGIGRKIPLAYLQEDKEVDSKKMGVTLPNGVSIAGIAKVSTLKTEVGIALGTKKGLVKISKTDFPNKEEFPVMLLDDDDEIIGAKWLGKTIREALFSFVSSDGNALIFDASSIRVSGSKSGGVRGFKLKESSKAISFGVVFDPKQEFYLTNTDSSIKKTQISEIPKKNKGGQGVAVHLFRKGESKLIGALNTNEGIVLAKDDNSSLPEPPFAKRAAGGVRIDFPVVVSSKFALIQ